MKTSVKLKFRSSTVEGKTGSIYMQFIKDRKVRALIIKEGSIYSEEWDETTESFRLNVGDSNRRVYVKSLYERVLLIRKQLIDIIGKLETRFCDYTIDEVLREYSRLCGNNGLITYVAQLASGLEAKHPRTARSYRSVARKIEELYGNVAMDQITPQFIKKFEKDILAQGKRLNTSSYYLRNLRAVLNHAVDEGVISPCRDRLFAGVFTGNDKTEKRAVKETIIESMETIDLSGVENKRLALARDAFMLCYYLRGISFIDLAHLKVEDIHDGCIFYTRHKTGQHFEIEVTPEIQVIIDRYRVPIKNNRSNYLLPFLRKGDSPVEYASALRLENDCLKRISVLIGLDKPLTTYTARHSWASIALAKGVSIELISQGLGHENVRTTMIYLKSFDYSSLHAANRKVICREKKVA